MPSVVNPGQSSYTFDRLSLTVDNSSVLLTEAVNFTVSAYDTDGNTLSPFAPHLILDNVSSETEFFLNEDGSYTYANKTVPTGSINYTEGNYYDFYVTADFNNINRQSNSVGITWNSIIKNYPTYTGNSDPVSFSYGFHPINPVSYFNNLYITVSLFDNAGVTITGEISDKDTQIIVTPGQHNSNILLTYDEDNSVYIGILPIPSKFYREYSISPGLQYTIRLLGNSPPIDVQTSNFNIVWPVPEYILTDVAASETTLPDNGELDFSCYVRQSSQGLLNSAYDINVQISDNGTPNSVSWTDVVDGSGSIILLQTDPSSNDPDVWTVSNTGSFITNPDIDQNNYTTYYRLVGISQVNSDYHFYTDPIQITWSGVPASFECLPLADNSTVYNATFDEDLIVHITILDGGASKIITDAELTVSITGSKITTETFTWNSTTSTYTVTLTNPEPITGVSTDYTITVGSFTPQTLKVVWAAEPILTSYQVFPASTDIYPAYNTSVIFTVFGYGADGVTFPNPPGITPTIIVGDDITPYTFTYNSQTQGYEYTASTQNLSAGGDVFYNIFSRSVNPSNTMDESIYTATVHWHPEPIVTSAVIYPSDGSSITLMDNRDTFTTILTVYDQLGDTFTIDPGLNNNQIATIKDGIPGQAESLTYDANTFTYSYVIQPSSYNANSVMYSVVSYDTTQGGNTLLSSSTFELNWPAAPPYLITLDSDLVEPQFGDFITLLVTVSTNPDGYVNNIAQDLVLTSIPTNPMFDNLQFINTGINGTYKINQLFNLENGDYENYSFTVSSQTLGVTSNTIGITWGPPPGIKFSVDNPSPLISDLGVTFSINLYDENGEHIDYPSGDEIEIIDRKTGATFKPILDETVNIGEYNLYVTNQNLSADGKILAYNYAATWGVTYTSRDISIPWLSYTTPYSVSASIPSLNQTSNSISLQWNIPPGIALRASSISPDAGAGVTFTVTLWDNNAQLLPGDETISINGGSVGPPTDSNGQVTFYVTNDDPAAGAHSTSYSAYCDTYEVTSQSVSINWPGADNVFSPSQSTITALYSNVYTNDPNIITVSINNPNGVPLLSLTPGDAVELYSNGTLLSTKSTTGSSIFTFTDTVLTASETTYTASYFQYQGPQLMGRRMGRAIVRQTFSAGAAITSPSPVVQSYVFPIDLTSPIVCGVTQANSGTLGDGLTFTVVLNDISGGLYTTGSQNYAEIFNVDVVGSVYQSSSTPSDVTNGATYTVFVPTNTNASSSTMGITFYYDVLSTIVPYPKKSTSNVNVKIIPTNLTPVPCFFGEAPVLTPSGYKRIDSLYDGDLIVTSRGIFPIKQIRFYNVPAKPETNPYRIPKGLYKATEDLLISPLHCVKVEDKMIEAKDLGLVQEKLTGTLTYYNIEMDYWDNMYVAGVEVETLANDAWVVILKGL